MRDEEKQESILDLCSEYGTGFEVINENNREAFYPLLMGIDEIISLEFSKNDSLVDNDIVESLKKIRDNIFKEEYQFNELESAIVEKIKSVLMLNDYSKRDISLSVSHLLQSVKRHRLEGGKRGYLSFISDFFNSVKEGEGDFEEEELDDDNFDEDESDDGDLDEDSEEEDELWSEGSYIGSVNIHSPEHKERMKYFREKADEPKEHNCKKCGTKIGKHNLYWHEGMCNDCFFDKYNM